MKHKEFKSMKFENLLNFKEIFNIWLKNTFSYNKDNKIINFLIWIWMKDRFKRVVFRAYNDADHFVPLIAEL